MQSLARSVLLAALSLSLSPLSVMSANSSSAAVPSSPLPLASVRTSPGDLEIGGELANLPKSSVRYVRYEDLLKLPQETYTISDDTNFKGKTEISGVPLTSLARLVGQSGHSDMIVAICDDKYRSNYPSEYLAQHHPILVLKINGKRRDQWPPSEYNSPLGPYLISHPTFKPSFTVLSHQDEAQIPFGVIRLDFRTQAGVFSNIKPIGTLAHNSPVWQGYEIARQDCYRCHGLYGEGGERASRSWLVLGAWASSDEARFKQYIHQPTSVQSCAKMPAHGDYDEATLSALTAYFRTFAVVRNRQ